ncbi:unnamed protein product, partial [Rotaria sp. Silwood1]
MDIKRLFDAIDFQLNKFGNKPDVLAAKINGEWKGSSAIQIQDTANKLSAALLQLGIGGNDYTAEGADKIAIISNNRPEWVITDIAVQQTGAILIPLYPTTNPLEVEFILNDCQAKYIFVSDAEIFDKIEGCNHYTELINAATETSLQKVEEIKKGVPVSHLATIIYTSGTTGTPKGVMLSHSNIYTCIIGISIYYAESLDTIGENIREVKPFGFSCVPRLLEKVYEKIMAKGAELTGIKRKLFYWAVSLGEKYDNNISGGLWYDFQLKIANKIIFKKWREALGGSVEFIVTGGAACPVHLLRIFNAASVAVYEGYGPTENSPVISVNRKGVNGNKFGTVGPPIDNIEVKLAEDGEIIVRGTTVMEGYYKRPDLTAETIINGWLHTGDIGTWIDNKFLKIIDRKKELFKTSGGKYVAPQPIESKCKESNFIEQILLIGDNKKFVGALIVPSFNELQKWYKTNGLTYTTNEVAIANAQ